MLIDIYGKLGLSGFAQTDLDLNHGGVTQVIANQLRALDRTCAEDHLRIALLCGGQIQGWPQDMGSSLHAVDVIMGFALDCGTTLIPWMSLRNWPANFVSNYRPWGFHRTRRSCTCTITALARTPRCRALRLLAEEGYALLLQIHDFAEDYRSRSYCHLSNAWNCRETSAVMYPQAEHVHYAVLNQRDYAVLTRAGVPSDRLHCFPNPLAASGRMTPVESVHRQVFDGYRRMLSSRVRQPAFHPDAAHEVVDLDSPSVISFVRTSVDGRQRILVVTNVADTTTVVHVPQPFEQNRVRELFCMGTTWQTNDHLSVSPAGVAWLTRTE